MIYLDVMLSVFGLLELALALYVAVKGGTLAAIIIGVVGVGMLAAGIDGLNDKKGDD